MTTTNTGHPLHSRGAQRALRTSCSLLALAVALSACSSDSTDPESESNVSAGGSSTGGAGPAAGGATELGSGGTGSFVGTGGNNPSGTGGEPDATGGLSGTGGESVGAGGESVGAGGAGAGTGGAPVARDCPKPDNELCHVVVAADNTLHEVIFIDEFEPTKSWSQTTQNKSGGNSPRQLQIVESPSATEGRSVLVSVDSGYEEYDLSNHALLDSKDLGVTGVRGVQRLPNGNTAVGYGDATLRIVDAGGTTVGQECSLPGSGSETLRVLTYVESEDAIYFGRGTQVFAVGLDCEEKWSATFPDGSSKAYRVIPREGGGAFAATGYPGTIIEFDAAGQVENEVGGLSEFPGVVEFSSGFDVTSTGNLLMANWWGHVASPPAEGPHLIEFNPQNEVVWTWGTQAEAKNVTNVLVIE